MSVYPFELDDSYPISAGFARGAAGAASGDAAALPSSVMKSRRAQLTKLHPVPSPVAGYRVGEDQVRGRCVRYVGRAYLASG
jgi:hypothetical protein